MSGFGAKQYKQTAVGTASKPQILLMLYEAAIRNVKKASECIDSNDLPGKGASLTKVHDIVNELLNTLDFEVGGDIARNLERLYNFMLEQLVQANIKNSKKELQVVQQLLETLLSGWREAVAKFAKENAKESSRGETGGETG